MLGRGIFINKVKSLGTPAGGRRTTFPFKKGTTQDMKRIIKEILEKTGKFYIAFVGDSLTSCEWVHPNWREIVEYVLKEELQKEFADWRIPSWGIRGFNFGYDGATTKDIWEKTDEIIGVKPDIVLGLMGGNDAPLGIEVEESVENIEKIFTKLTNGGIGVYWATSLPAMANAETRNEKPETRRDKNDEYRPYAEATMAIKTNPGVNKLNMFEEYAKFDLERFYTFRSEENPVEGIKAGEIDPQHPNQLGNAYVAKIFLEKAFGINFDPEKYIEETLRGEKLPGY